MSNASTSRAALRTLNDRLTVLDAEIEEIYASERSAYVKHLMFTAALATRTAVVQQVADLG